MYELNTDGSYMYIVGCAVDVKFNDNILKLILGGIFYSIIN